jgi:hypothetical protein
MITHPESADGPTTRRKMLISGACVVTAAAMPRVASTQQSILNPPTLKQEQTTWVQ